MSSPSATINSDSPVLDPLSMKALVPKLQALYPNLSFKFGRRFAFKPPKTISIGPDEGPYTPQLLFHELGHALSKEYAYSTKVERLRIESIAWQTGKAAYQEHQQALNLPSWDDDFAEDNLDTYRDWLHQKSICRTCGLTMFEDDSGWHCPYCDQFKTL